MDEEVFNLELRKSLKRFGVTAQHEIEKAVETGLREGKLAGNEILPVQATLSITGCCRRSRSTVRSLASQDPPGRR